MQALGARHGEWQILPSIHHLKVLTTLPQHMLSTSYGWKACKSTHRWWSLGRFHHWPSTGVTIGLSVKICFCHWFFFLPVCRVHLLQRGLKAIGWKAELPGTNNGFSLAITLVTSPSSALCLRFWLGLCFYKWLRNFVDFVNCPRSYVIGLFPRHPSTPSFCGCFQNNLFGSIRNVSVSVLLSSGPRFSLGVAVGLDRQRRNMTFLFENPKSSSESMLQQVPWSLLWTPVLVKQCFLLINLADKPTRSVNPRELPRPAPSTSSKLLDQIGLRLKRFETCKAWSCCRTVRAHSEGAPWKLQSNNQRSVCETDLAQTFHNTIGLKHTTGCTFSWSTLIHPTKEQVPGSQKPMTGSMQLHPSNRKIPKRERTWASGLCSLQQAHCCPLSLACLGNRVQKHQPP